MAICKHCNQDMLNVDDCSLNRHVEFEDGRVLPAIPWQRGERCPDCGVTWGHYHHLGCDHEVCPACAGQLISCECWSALHPVGHA
jgi:hypothetical protein